MTQGDSGAKRAGSTPRWLAKGAGLLRQPNAEQRRLAMLARVAQGDVVLSAGDEAEWRDENTGAQVIGDQWPGGDADTEAGRSRFQHEIEVLVFVAGGPIGIL